MVEGAALEMLFVRKGNEGSNPSLSVLKSRSIQINQVLVQKVLLWGFDDVPGKPHLVR